MVKSGYSIDLTNTIYYAILQEFGNVTMQTELSRIDNTDEIELKISFDGRSWRDMCSNIHDASVVIRVSNVPNFEHKIMTEVFAIMKLEYNGNDDIESLVKKYEELRPIFTTENKIYHERYFMSDPKIKQEKIANFKFTIYDGDIYTNYDDIGKKTIPCIRAFLEILNLITPIPRSIL